MNQLCKQLEVVNPTKLNEIGKDVIESCLKDVRKWTTINEKSGQIPPEIIKQLSKELEKIQSDPSMLVEVGKLIMNLCQKVL